MRRLRFPHWNCMLLGILLFASTNVHRLDADVPSTVPAQQASGLKAFFRSGQTFITWQEGGDEAVRYRLYRSLSPIKAFSDLTSAQCVGEVGSQSGLNLMASIDLMTLQQKNRTNPDLVYEIPKREYFVIDENAGPLSPGTGVFVYTAKAGEKAHYAATVVRDGVENTEIMDGEAGNALSAAVEEKVAFPAAVLQRSENGYQDYVHWTDCVGTAHYPAMGSVASIPYNFRVFVPEKKGPLPLILKLHGHTVQYKNTSGVWSEDERNTLLIALDSPAFSSSSGRYPKIKDVPWIPYPPLQGWSGFNENFGTGKPESEGQTKPYTVDRVMWMIDWAKHNFDIDTQRVSMRGISMGASGVMQIAMAHPERFAAINPITPPLSSGGSRRRRSAGSEPTSAASAPNDSRRSGSDSGASLFRADLAEYLAAHPEVDFPFILFNAGRTDTTVGWTNKPEFMKRVAPLHVGAILYWDLRPHSGEMKGDPPKDLDRPIRYWNCDEGEPIAQLHSFAINQSYLAVANLTADNDPGTVDFAVAPDKRPAWDSQGAGDFIGTINGAFTWERDSIVDEADHYEVTMKLLPFAKQDEAMADITPRRLQKFHPEAGSTVHYTITSVDSQTELLSGDLTGDEYGRVTIKKAPITKDGICLILRKQAK